jgi:hypothetical protein
MPIGNAGTVTKHGKKEGLPTTLIVVVSTIVLAAIIGFFLFGFGSGSGSAAPGTATAGGSPAGPASAPIIGKPTFEQLAQKSPEEIRDYMKANFKYKHYSDEENRARLLNPTTPEDILASGRGDYGDFADFFASALVEKGCWQWKNIRVVWFEVLHNGNHEQNDVRTVAVYYDPRDNQNYYLVPEPPDFPIYKIGNSDDPIPLEEARLGEKIAEGSVDSNKYCR